MKNTKKTSASRFFFCPAATSLNKNNETGSIGQIAYLFIYQLSKLKSVNEIKALVMNSYNVEDFEKVSIISYFSRNYKDTPLFSIAFYITSFIKNRFSKVYTNSEVIHHLLPFAPGKSFNLFFILKDSSKVYIIGPILGPHTALVKRNQGLIERALQNILSPLLKFLSNMTLKNADVVLFTDQYSLESFKDYAAISKRVEILGYGVTPSIFKTKNHAIGNVAQVLFVGRLTETKGCEYLIKAMGIIERNHSDVKIKCTIAGDGPLKANLEKLAEKEGARENISFLGSVSDNAEFRKLYNDCTLVCLPVLSDHWMSAKEALLCGKPVIITDIASHSEHVQNGVNGLLIPPKDSEAIAKAILTLVVNKQLQNIFSKNAYSRAHKIYSWENIISEYSKIIDDELRSKLD